jgi:undecaprenyl-diphosphatase
MSRTPSSASAPPHPDADARFGARTLLAALAIALVAIPFGLLLFFVQDKWRPLLRADAGARDELHAYAVGHDWFVTAMRTLSTIGSAAVYIPVLLVVATWLWRRRRRRLAVFVVVAVAGGSLLNTLVKLAVDRARPVLPNPVAHASGMSFPSGHAQSAVVVASVLLLVFLPRLHGAWRVAVVALAVAMVLAIGFSRIALGVHYASDVLAGYALGGAWVAAITAAFGAWREERAAAPPAQAVR